MKKNNKWTLVIILILAIFASYLAGSHIAEQKHKQAREQRCEAMISFAVSKLEKDVLVDQDTIEALVSNIYAAYQFCDDPDLAGQLHDLWNTLMFREDEFIGREDVLAERLTNIAEVLQMKD